MTERELLWGILMWNCLWGFIYFNHLLNDRARRIEREKAAKTKKPPQPTGRFYP